MILLKTESVCCEEGMQPCSYVTRTILSQILKPTPQDTLCMFTSVTIELMSSELVLKGAAGQLSMCVFLSPNQKLLSSGHLENCWWKRSLPPLAHPDGRSGLPFFHVPTVVAAIMSCYNYLSVYSFHWAESLAGKDCVSFITSFLASGT